MGLYLYFHPGTSLSVSLLVTRRFDELANLSSLLDAILDFINTSVFSLGKRQKVLLAIQVDRCVLSCSRLVVHLHSDNLVIYSMCDLCCILYITWIRNCPMLELVGSWNLFSAELLILLYFIVAQTPTCSGSSLSQFQHTFI